MRVTSIGESNLFLRLVSHNGEVIDGVAQGVELCSVVPDITSMSIQVYKEGVLFLASPAFNGVDDITRLAGGCGSYIERLIGGGAHEHPPCSDVFSCVSTSVVAWTIPLVCLIIP